MRLNLPGRAHPRLASFVLFAALAIAHTWPLTSAPGRLSRNDHPDTVLGEWAIAWVAHQAPRDPPHLFDANIFHPERGTLAYSEPLIVPGLMAMPLFWLGASTVLAYNLMVLAGFTLTAWAAWLLVWRWTGDMAAGIMSGVAVAFNAHLFTRLPHLQALHAEFLPLALLAFDALLREPATKSALRLAAVVFFQGLTSIYLLVFTLVALVAGGLARPEDWGGRRLRRVLPFAAAAAVAAVILLLPFLLQYRRVGQVRALDEVAFYSASWRDYLATPAKLHHGTWSAQFFGGTASLFPGFVATALALVAIGTGVATADPRARMALLFGAVGFALSFGPATPGYVQLYTWIPLLQGIRAAARFGYLLMVAVAILAGFGLAAIRRSLSDRRLRLVATVSILVLANVDAWVAPIRFTQAAPISRLHGLLRRAPGAVVVEFPFYPPDRTFHNAWYLLDSTRHWRPMLNGYSGLVPASYEAHYRALLRFPDPTSVEALRAAGVTHVFVHYKDLAAWAKPGAVDELRRSLDLRPIEEDGDVGLYRLVLPTEGR